MQSWRRRHTDAAIRVIQARRGCSDVRCEMLPIMTTNQSQIMSNHRSFFTADTRHLFCLNVVPYFPLDSKEITRPTSSTLLFLPLIVDPHPTFGLHLDSSKTRYQCTHPFSISYTHVLCSTIGPPPPRYRYQRAMLVWHRARIRKRRIAAASTIVAFVRAAQPTRLSFAIQARARA